MRSRLNWFEITALGLILLLAAYLRLANVADNPGWYTDEGTHINIADNLSHGRMQYLAINQSTLLFARLPLFEILLAATFRLFHTGIDVLRALTAPLGVVSVGMLYAIMRRMTDRWLALLATLLLSIYPPAILYSRFGFSYNLLTPLLLIVYWSLWLYLDRSSQRIRPLLIASFAVGLGIISDLGMFSLIVPVLIVVAVRNWRHVPLSLAIMLMPFGAYVLISLSANSAAFWFDLRFTFSRLNPGSVFDQLGNILNNFKILIAQDGWLLPAFAGSVFLRPARSRWLALLLFGLPLIIIGRTVALYSLSYYYIIPSLPLIAIGLSALIRVGLPWLIDFAARLVLVIWTRGFSRITQQIPAKASSPLLVRRIAFVGVFILATLPFIASTSSVLDQTQRGFQTDIAPFLIDPEDAQIAAAFVNGHTQADDLVIASPGLAWLLTANAADFQMSIAATGRATPHLPADIPPDRFAFNPDYTHAQFSIVDNLWRNWAVPNVSGVSEMLQVIEAWPLVLKSGAIEVYRNPK
jgi:4-amino-4-deoxy-L-arabinose transferase-like glycosyltransferase